MVKRVQINGGGAAAASTFAGLAREMYIDTTNNVLRIHDGVLPGGYPLARQDLSNVTALPTVIGTPSGTDQFLRGDGNWTSTFSEDVDGGGNVIGNFNFEGTFWQRNIINPANTDQLITMNSRLEYTIGITASINIDFETPPGDTAYAKLLKIINGSGGPWTPTFREEDTTPLIWLTPVTDFGTQAVNTQTYLGMTWFAGGHATIAEILVVEP